MRSILGLSIAVLFGVAAVDARAQYPGYEGGSGGGFGGAPGAGYPGLYGGGLSPYLNLRSRNLGNPAVNYYNFVRPYTGGTFGNAIVPPPSAGRGCGSFSQTCGRFMMRIRRNCWNETRKASCEPRCRPRATAPVS